MPGWLIFIIVGVVAGFLGGLIVKGGGMGFLWNLIVGIAGSFLGGWLFGAKIHWLGGVWDQIIIATIGAIILLLILSLFNKKKK